MQGEIDISSTNSGNADEISTYWEKFYSAAPTTVPGDASNFARHVAERCEGIDVLVELGCGTGRDAIWLAKSGAGMVLATDGSSAALDFVQERSRSEGINSLFTRRVDLHDDDSLNWVAGWISDQRGSNGNHAPKVVIYGRFLLHAIDEPAQDNLIRFAASHLKSGDLLALEYRAKELNSEEYVFGSHYRRPVDPSLVEQSCYSFGFKTVSTEVSDEFATYKNERPLVARTLAEM